MTATRGVRPRRRHRPAPLLAAACLTIAASAHAQRETLPERVPSATADSARTPHPSLDDTVALGAFLDGAFQQFIDELHVPGAVVAVIKNGRVLYAHGYGYADVQRRTPVDPATSLFRIGSTSKLFTWTAVM